MLNKSNLVAVYGSLRQGLGNHTVLGSSRLLGTQEVAGWDMYSMGGFPAIVQGTNTITVEVYEVHSESVAEGLDMLEGYPTFYNRQLIDTDFGQAWVYFQYEPPTHTKVEHGDWKLYVKENGYYG